MSLGERLRERREKFGKSQLTVASDLGLNNTQLSRYEAGINNPDPDAIKKLAEYYGTTIDYLFGRTDISTPDAKINPREQAQFEAFISNQEYGVFIKEYLEASESRKKKLMEYWETLKEAEIGRKVLDSQDAD